MHKHFIMILSCLFLVFSCVVGIHTYKTMPIWKEDTSPCPFGNMSRITTYWGSFCIDQYESYNNKGKADSGPEKVPWEKISWYNAKRACEKARKHLCKDYEWIAACNLNGKKYNLTGEEDNETYGCNTGNACAGKTCRTGSRQNCVSDKKVFDMIGNLFEWTDALVPDDSWAGESQHVGIILDEPTKKYGDDFLYRYRRNMKGRAFQRGGGWAGPTQMQRSFNRGCFYLRLFRKPQEQAQLMGFRCCADSVEHDNSPPVYEKIEDALVDHNYIFIENFNLGREALEKKQWRKAEKYFEKCFRIAPNHTATILNLATTFLGANNLKNAVEMINLLENSSKAKYYVLYNKGIYYAHTEQWNKTYDIFTEMRALYPEDKDVQLNRHKAYAAKEVIEKTMKKIKENIDIYETLPQINGIFPSNSLKNRYNSLKKEAEQVTTASEIEELYQKTILFQKNCAYEESQFYSVMYVGILLIVLGIVYKVYKDSSK